MLVTAVTLPSQLPYPIIVCALYCKHQIVYGFSLSHFLWLPEALVSGCGDDTGLVADSEEKLCRLVSEFGRVCERRKLKVNVGKSKVMRCSRYGNGDRMHVILNGEPLEEVDCFKYLGSQVAANGGSERDLVHNE